MMTVVLGGSMVFTACSSSDDAINEQLVYNENGQAGVKSEFVISIPRSVVGTTRMSNDVTQESGSVSQFRGIDNIRLIPFDAKPTTSSTKLTDIMRLGSITALSSPGAVNYKVYSDKFVPVGTKYFLFYGKAIDAVADEAISSRSEKFYYGTLNAKGLSDDEFTTVNDIMFSPVQINTSAAAQAGNATGQAIVAFLTQMANISVSGVAAPNDKWSTTSNVALASLYKNFLGLTTGSSNSMAIMLSKIYFSMDVVKSSDPAHSLAVAIKDKIKSVCSSTPVNNNPVSLISTYSGYPENIGLPDGAVRLRWNQTSKIFEDISANYTKGFRLKITDYVYPAALWYYANTSLKAATEKKSDKYDNAGTWNGVINSVYSGAEDEVEAGTRSIALRSPANYGVGRLQTKVKMGSGTFYDGNGQEVNTTAGYTLKGILIGGQNSVGYDFTSKGDENLAIYDCKMASNSIIAKADYTTSANQTLALETKSNQVVHAALELVNNGDAFMGFDGVIPHGGTFYLAVKLDPATASNYKNTGDEDDLNKIVMQDHVTKLTVTIKNGSLTVDRNNDGTPDVYIKDENGVPTGVDVDGDGLVDPYDIDGDGNNDTFITDPVHGGPGWDIDNDGEVDIHVTPDQETGKYPDAPNNPEGLGGATNGVPDLTSPGIELGTSVDLEWQEGLILNPEI